MKDKEGWKEPLRFRSLLDLHGEPVSASSTASSSSSVASELINVRFVNQTSGWSPKTAKIEKKLPIHMTIQNLRVLLLQLFGLPPDTSLSLSFKRSSDDIVGIPMDDDASSLSYFGVSEEGQVVVTENF